MSTFNFDVIFFVICCTLGATAGMTWGYGNTKFADTTFKRFLCTVACGGVAALVVATFITSFRALFNLFTH